jgi:hypothetical protein
MNTFLLRLEKAEPGLWEAALRRADGRPMQQVVLGLLRAYIRGHVKEGHMRPEPSAPPTSRKLR